MHRSRARVTIAAATLVAAGVLGPAPVAFASAEWAAFQPSVPYTVYEAYDTLSLTRTTFELNNECMQADANVAVVYKNAATKKIKLYESSSLCLAGGGSYAPIVFTTFPVQGGAATAEVYPACTTQLQCEFPSMASLKARGARVQVTLAGSGGHANTHITVKTRGLSYREIKKFVWGLGLP